MEDPNILIKVVENRLGFLSLKACAATDIGQRPNNEDSFLINEKLGLFIVADGMGGHELGEYASWFASKKVERLIGMLDDLMSPAGTESIQPYSHVREGNEPYDVYLRYAISVVHKELKKKAAKNKMERAMGTTLVSLLFRKNKVYIANIGDSRAYKISGGNLVQVTHDHSVVARRMRMGELTQEEAKTARGRNIITKCIGVKESAEADIYAMTLYPRERFLICTDGLSGVLDEKTISGLVAIRNVRKCCHSLVSAARDLGGRDNITAILVEVEGVGEQKKGKRFVDEDTQEETL